MKKQIAIILLVLMNACVFGQHVVTSTADAGANTLRNAIAVATNGETITFAAGLANQTITLNTTLEIPVAKSLIIDAANAPNISVSGNNAVRIFLLRSTSVSPTSLTLKNLTLTKGFTTEYGGAIKSEHQGKININNCVFTYNNAEQGGSAIFSAFEGKTYIINSKFDNNVSTAKNTERGSTVMLWGPFSQTIQRCDFTNNRGINGAAINGLNAGMLVEDCNFLNNTTSTAFLDTGKENDFLRGFGGAIYADRATAGPPSTALGSIIIRRSKFEGNVGQSDGGAMYLYTDETDNVLVENCYFNNNEARQLSGSRGGGGGAIEQMNNSKNKGFVIRNSTFSNNSAAVNGGAIRADWADTEISNCTFYNNKALQTKTDGYSANGGALVTYSMSNSSVNITNCTFANNYAGWVGGAICSDKAATKIKNSIFYQNTAGNGGNNWNIQHHSADELVDLGNNIQFPAKFTNNSNDYNVSSAVTIINPKLSAMADNGGFSPTLALSDGSPAINKGSGCSPTDQRGAPRAGICDIGAYEFNSTITNVQERSKSSTFRLYPNPSINNEIRIAASDHMNKKTVNLKVYDALGKTVFRMENVSLGDEYVLSIASLASGIYTLHLEHGEETFTKSFVK